LIVLPVYLLIHGLEEVAPTSHFSGLAFNYSVHMIGNDL